MTTAAPLPPELPAPLDGALLDDALRDRCRERRVPALSAAVARGGRVAWAGSAGWARADAGTAFRIGSITKPMTAVAVLRLVAAGRVGLNDPVGRHLPDAPAPDATLAHLLTHTAGLPAEPPGPWWERHGAGTWAELVESGVVPLEEPGGRHHYSNVGYAVLGRLLEVSHGRPWDAVLRDEVWSPLGMTNTGRTPSGDAAVGYAVHPDAGTVLVEPVASYGAMGPAGEVWSTPSDLVRFGSWLVGAGPDDAAGEDVLSREWRRRMTTARAVVDDDGRPFTAAWGLGVSVHHTEAGRRTVGHGGSVPGFTATLRADPATGEAWAVCGSSTAGFGDASFVEEVLAGSPPLAPANRAADVVDRDALALTGTWYWGPMAYTLAARADGRLELSADGGRSTVFGRADDGGWVGVEGGYWRGERLRAVAPGTPAEALDVGTFHLTRAPYDPATAVPGGLDPRGWRAVPDATDGGDVSATG
ncbi:MULTISPECIES: serine hydrolase domain-containing protein [unclassified Isoptericola]|uniref:serine hydrolase domain-containing protein n=1 Tax=unclassified Isoptericola TaxID=2623355 RepID=UPI00365D22E3